MNSPDIPLTPYDREFYRERLEAFLPARLVDIHTHVWRAQDRRKDTAAVDPRTASWPARVAAENPAEHLLATYEALLPGKRVTPLIFATVPGTNGDGELARLNAYVASCARDHDLPALLFSHPAWDQETLARELERGPFLGIKSYLSLCPPDLTAAEISVFDFFPRHQLEVVDRLGLILMLHLPRPGRLRDTANLDALLEIAERYPRLHLVVAHVGRAYCNEDVGEAFERLRGTERLLFDFSANTNQWVFQRCLETMGPRRLLFGSDLPILRMRTRRICEQGTYVNLVPRGLYGEVGADRHLREVEGKEAARLTFFLYEELDAMRRACATLGLARREIDDLFRGNGTRLLRAAGFSRQTSADAAGARDHNTETKGDTP